MPFIGIISEESTENMLDKRISDELNLGQSSVLYIKEKSIENMKNITFETIILAREFKKVEQLKKILEKATYLVINSDIEKNLNLLENIKATVVTYGFNLKSTITASSVKEDEIILCIQRSFKNKENKIIEPQEIKIPIIQNANSSMAIATLLLIYGKVIN